MFWIDFWNFIYFNHLSVSIYDEILGSFTFSHLIQNLPLNLNPDLRHFICLLILLYLFINDLITSSINTS